MEEYDNIRFDMLEDKEDLYKRGFDITPPAPWSGVEPKNGWEQAWRNGSY